MGLIRNTVDTDERTGEIVSSSLERVDPNYWPGEWCRFELLLAKLLRQQRKNLTMTDVVILVTLVEHMKSDNLVPISQRVICDLMEVSRQAVNKSINKLIDYGWVERLGTDLYRIDVDLMWKGKTEDRFELAKNIGRVPGQKLSEAISNVSRA